MVTVRGGGLYLKARDRIAWMRGEPQPQPDWTIDTYPEEIERGKFISNQKVEGGYARYRANVFDVTGVLSAQEPRPNGQNGSWTSPRRQRRVLSPVPLPSLDTAPRLLWTWMRGMSRTVSQTPQYKMPVPSTSSPPMSLG